MTILHVVTHDGHTLDLWSSNASDAADAANHYMRYYNSDRLHVLKILVCEFLPTDRFYRDESLSDKLDILGGLKKDLAEGRRKAVGMFEVIYLPSKTNMREMPCQNPEDMIDGAFMQTAHASHEE